MKNPEMKIYVCVCSFIMFNVVYLWMGEQSWKVNQLSSLLLVSMGKLCNNFLVDVIHYKIFYHLLCQTMNASDHNSNKL